jgi:hypothetical protein
MATFDETQVTNLARIFGTTSDLMSTWLDVRTSIITDADKTAILADITSYQAIQDDNLQLEPKERNFGTRLNASDKRSLIRNRIAGLIGWQMTASAGLVRS